MKLLLRLRDAMTILALLLVATMLIATAACYERSASAFTQFPDGEWSEAYVDAKYVTVTGACAAVVLDAPLYRLSWPVAHSVKIFRPLSYMDHYYVTVDGTTYPAGAKRGGADRWEPCFGCYCR